MSGLTGAVRFSTGCPTGKRTYANRKMARRARKSLHAHLTIYPCEHCSGFHLGHPAHDVKRGNIARAAMRSKLPQSIRNSSTGSGKFLDGPVSIAVARQSQVSEPVVPE